MSKNQNPKVLRASFIFLFTLFLLFFQNCSGSFNSVGSDTNTASNSQGSSEPPGAGNPSVPSIPSTPINLDLYQPVTGFNKPVFLQSSICDISTTGSVRCMGSLRTDILDSNSNRLTSFTDRLTDMNFNLNVKQLTDSCMLTVDGKVFCWGNNRDGELGVSAQTQNYSAVPLEVNLGGSAKLIAEVSGGLCALMVSGAVKCWGIRYDLDGTSKTLPAEISGLPVAAKEIYASSRYARQFCAWLNNNDLYCWGLRIDTSRGDTTSNPVKVYNANNITQVLPGSHHEFCILTSTGQVSCFKETASNGLLTLELKPIAAVVELTSGGYNGALCARTQAGDVYCWGMNMFGRLGFVLKHNEEIVTPTLIPEWKNATALVMGTYSTCALMPDTTLKCLGFPNGTFLDYTRSEFKLSDLGVVGAVSSVVDNAALGICYQTAAGASECLRRLSNNEDYTKTSAADYHKISDEIVAKPFSIPVPGGSRLGSLRMGKAYVGQTPTFGGCFINTNQMLECFGDNSKGLLGNGTLTSSATSVVVTGLTGVVKHADYGLSIRCALTSQNRLYCWGGGNNSLYAPLNLPEGVVKSPVEMTHIGAIKDFELTYFGVDVVRMDGSVKSYGRAPNFELNGTKAFNFNSLCGHMNDNSVQCYQDETSSFAVVQNLSSNSFKFFGSCAIDEAKQVKCWGENTYGQLGQGNRQVYNQAVTVRDVTNASLVFGYSNAKCAYVDENLGSLSRILCWGPANGENPGLGTYEKTELRGYKPILSPNGSVQAYVNGSGQVKLQAGFKIPAAPYVLLQKK